MIQQAGAQPVLASAPVTPITAKSQFLPQAVPVVRYTSVPQVTAGQSGPAQPTQLQAMPLQTTPIASASYQFPPTNAVAYAGVPQAPFGSHG